MGVECVRGSAQQLKLSCTTTFQTGQSFLTLLLMVIKSPVGICAPLIRVVKCHRSMAFICWMHVARCKKLKIPTLFLREDCNSLPSPFVIVLFMFSVFVDCILF